MDIIRWLLLKSDWLYSFQLKMEKLFTVSKNKTGSWLWLRLWTLLQNSGLNCKGKTTRPFRYNLNQIQILYDYTVEVTNRFKGLDLVDRVPEQLWTNCHGSGTTSMNWIQVHNTVQEVVTKTIPKRNKEGKVVWGCLRRPYKQLRKEKWKAKEKGKDRPKWMQSSENSKERESLKWTIQRNRGK